MGDMLRNNAGTLFLMQCLLGKAKNILITSYLLRKINCADHFDLLHERFAGC
jgi:hypothetical protein